MEQFYKDFKEKAQKNMSPQEFSKLKRELAKTHKLDKIPTDSQITLKTGIISKSKPVRTISGVAPIALMSAPHACPHGKCLYCPGGPSSPFGDVPQSYTGKEPSTLRGARNNYDPYLITFNRLEQYLALGHNPEKVEIIIQGGTFPALKKEYQEEFITYALKALNDFGDKFIGNEDEFKKFFELPGKIGDEGRAQRIKEKALKMKGKSTLEIEKKRNETAKIRCVALCIETKPDWCFEEHIDQMLRLGCTRVEMGVQCLRESVMRLTNRGHTLEDVKRSTKLMRNSLLKIGYHMMPGLPGMTKEKDIEDGRELFENEAYKPDALKIYPTTVIRGTGLWGMWRAGKYKPISTEQACDIILETKKHVPKWCRIMRVQRDIPSTEINAGPSLNNLRQMIHKKMEERGVCCKCIRCREPKEQEVDWKSATLEREDYLASEGREIFLSYTDKKNDYLLGFLRLRIIPESHRPEIRAGSAGIRELHVYGSSTSLGCEGKVQHRGIGKMLMAEAEKIAKEEFKCKKITVIAGIGVREYYYKLGYKKDGPYVSKNL